MPMPRGGLIFLALALTFEAFLWSIPDYQFESPPYEAAALRLKSDMADSPAAFDVITLGDCTGWSGIRPRILEAKLGGSVYNFCVNAAQTHLVSHVILNRYLNRCSSPPKLVVFQVSPFSFLGPYTIDAEQAKVKILPYIRMDADLLDELPATARGDLLRLHFLSLVPSVKVNTMHQTSRWYKVIRKDNRQDYERRVKFYQEERGFFVLDETASTRNPAAGDRMDGVPREFVVSTQNAGYLKKILTTLSDRKIPVLVTTAAIRSDISGDLQTQNNILNPLNDYIRRELTRFPNVIAFEDMSAIASDPAYFTDNMHLSQKGADVYSEELAARIQRHFGTGR